MEAPFPQAPVVGTEKNTPAGQTAGEAKAGGLGKTDNAPGGRIFPALRVAFWRTTAGVAPLVKAASLAGGARLDGSSPQNAMTTAGA